MQEQTYKKHKFLMQGSILAIAGIFVRIIGLLYRIPMVNIIGTRGNGYYTSAYGVYSLFLILSSYTFPAAISKIISQRLASGRLKDVKNVIKYSFILAIVVGLITSLIMYFGADMISFLHRKPYLKFALRALAPTLFIMSILGILRGIFQGMGNMVPTAVSQIFEQIANAITSLIFAFILFNRGKIANIIYDSEEYSYAFGAEGGAIGTGIGAFVALVFLTLMLIKLQSKFKRFIENNNNYRPETAPEIYGVLFSTIVPIVIASTIYNLTTVVDDLIFSNALTFMKSELNIVVLWGVFGNYHLLFNIPVAVASSLTSSIIPSISASVAQNDVREVVLKVKYSVKYAMLIVVPAFVGLFVLADPICRVLFREHLDMLISMLRAGSIAVVFFSYATVTNGILHGLGLYNLPLKNAVIALVVHIAAMIGMLLLNLNIYAVVYGMIVFAIVLSVLNQRDINRIVRYRNSKFQRRYILTFSLMFMSAGLMGVATYFTNRFLIKFFANNDSFFMLVTRLVVCIVIGGFVYSFFVIMLGVVRKRDAQYIPFISKFSIFLRG